MDKNFIDFLKSRASIVDVISNKVKLTRSGKDWFCRCPFHSEKTASFKVSPDGYYYCFGCGAKGDVINFVMEFEKVTFQEAVESIANMYGIEVPKKEKPLIPDINIKIYSAMESIKNIFVSQLKEKAGLEARNYLSSRKISQESIDKFQLGFSCEKQNVVPNLKKLGFSEDILVKTGVFYKNQYNNELVNRFAGRLMFPIIDSSGKCTGFGGRIMTKSDGAKYINSPESEIFVKSQHLYGYSLAKRGKTREIIIVEGYLDVIAMHQAGFDGAVAPLGTSISETQINMCWRVCDNPIITLDGDNAGIKASYRWIDRILAALIPGKSFKFARLPHNADPDSLIFNNQTDVIADAVKNAAQLSDWMYEGAFLLYPSETPEQKAALIKMLLEKIEIIKDIAIKRLYIQHIKQKEQDLYRGKSALPKVKAVIKPVIHVKEKTEKILLVAIINHPYILDKVVENFAKIEFSLDAMREIKNIILDFYGKYFIMGENEKYSKAIANLEKEVADFAESVELHAKFVGKKVADEEVIDGWNKLCEKYFADPVIAEDLQKASSSLKFSFSDDDWQRLKALKKESLFKNRVQG